MKITKGRRAYLVMCCEVAESIASGMRHLRKTKPWTVAPEGKAFILHDSLSGTMAHFNALLAAHREEIVRGLLGAAP